MKILISALAAASVVLPTAASAQLGMLDAPAPGYSSILNSDYATAEREIRESQTSPFDPARVINLGVVLAKTGHRDEAASQFQRVLMQDDVQLVVADGKTAMSHDVARLALASLQGGVLSR